MKYPWWCFYEFSKEEKYQDADYMVRCEEDVKFAITPPVDVLETVT